MRIDAHVHYIPPELADELEAFVAQEPYWALMLTSSSAGRRIQGWATAERMIEDMDRAGLDRVMLLGEYRQQHAGCVARNDQALAIVRRWPERVIGFAVLQPKAGQAALDELARCVDGGLRGVGELGPYGQGYRLDDPDFLRVVEACIRYDIPLCLHTNEEVGHFYAGKAVTPLREFYRLACRYPELKLVLAHWGGGLLFYELMPGVRRALRNVWYDTAASPLIYPTERIFRAALACVDHRKLLYGSDYPLRLYPRRQSGPDFRPFMSEIESLGLDKEVYDDIMGHNAERLLSQPALRPAVTQVHDTMPSPRIPIEPFMAVSAVAQAWPQTQAIFARHGIPWEDTPVPHWEPIAQAAAARGLGPEALNQLMVALNEAIGQTPQDSMKQALTDQRPHHLRP